MSSLQPPDTPIMLYIGAGLDLSPLLTFAPGGPPYPISTPTRSIEQSYTYTSFIFVDAKPRHTFAYMVPDFNEWKTEEGRVRNVLHYSQGMLDRWRAIPGAPDLILFEGGGTPEQRQTRLHDPAWHFAKSPKCKRSVLHSRSRSLQEQERPRPLTTLYYLFNTLDVEMMQAPRMARLWESVEALYVHGLKIHPRTGAGLGAGGPSDTTEEKPLPLSKSLKRCFVLVGSWSGKGGVRDVDFVLQARERLRHAALWSRYHYQAGGGHTPLFPYPASSTESSPSSSVSSLSLAPITFYRPRTHYPSPSGDTSDDEEERKASSVLDQWDTPPSSPLSSLDDLSSFSVPTFGLDPFHIPIPQIAYSPKLWWRGGKMGRGRYFVMRSVSECMEVVHAREKRAEVGCE